MEEDIDKLEDFLEYNAFLKDAVISDNIRELAVYMTKNEYKAIEHLIERNKELEEKNKELQKYMKDYLIPKSTINLVYIPKSKVRKKIKELNKKYDKFTDYEIISKQCCECKIVVLKELLED